jgi:predicted esterase YcpF (UPF0227 family)
VARYHGCRQVVIDGGDHGFSDFGLYLDTVLEFCDAGRFESTLSPRVR